MASTKSKGETSTLEADLYPTKLLQGTEVDSKYIDIKQIDSEEIDSIEIDSKIDRQRDCQYKNQRGNLHPGG